MSFLEVLSPGLLTTVQDLGRPGYGPLGVSASGAADPTALRIANRLVGNPEGAAGLEMTLQGGQFQFTDAAVVALGGSAFEAPLWQAFEVAAGEVLRVGRSTEGARCYLAVRGGIRVPLLLGSASTHLVSGLGGLEGRALRRGDRLEIGDAGSEAGLRQVEVPASRRDLFRVTDGPQLEWFTADSVAAFYSSTYKVTADVNRMGIRLQGAGLALEDRRELITEGVALGCVQVPAGGQPVILFVEQQTTGGYPKIANVIAADLPALGQLKPGDAIRLRRVDLREARELLYIQERWIRSI
jgi:biotin-dependent carboxylase-like uncharacterized protein